ncbi:MAG: PH domain-containing protein, partial [Calditrichaeota bacterium]|nr:PH domain-containing protein [Calditrichota bacterium]
MTESQASWQRLSAFSVFFFIIKFIRIYWYGFVPLLLSDSTFQTNKWLLFFLALMLIIIFAFLRYYFFQYRINTNKITIKTGVFIKREREMSRDRIQHMNLEQNVIYQYLKLRRVRFESAGSAKTEFVLPAIGHGAFEDIREFMENEEEVKSQPELDQSKNDVLYRLGLKDLIIHGISSSRIGIVIGGIFTFYDSIKQNLNDWFDTFIDLEAAIENDILINNSVTLILIYILSLLILIFIFSVLFEVMIYYGFHLKFANGIF